MKHLATCMAAAASALVLAATSQAITPHHLSVILHRTNPCLAQIVDVEDGTYQPTRSFGGYGDFNASYGLGQADPGTKMVGFSYTVGTEHAGQSPGPRWATDLWTQLRWMRNYVLGRYGSYCGARDFRMANGYY